MTPVVIKNATIVDKNSSFHNQTVDIKIENGIITEIAKDIATPENAMVVEKENLYVSQGWFDSSVSIAFRRESTPCAATER